MASPNTNSYDQVYNVREDDTLTSRVALVVCVLVQRGLYIAGFSIAKELLTIHYSGYSKTKPIWALDYFEQLIASEPLLAVREKVKGVFISSDRNLIVPDELYNEKDARNWLSRIFFIEQQDKITVYPLENEKASFLQAIPLNISELVRINFKKAEIQPLQAYLFGERQAQSLHLQLCLSNEQVTATLHNYSQLLWHNVFEYSCAEDIAYAIRLLCKENYIDAGKLNINCNSLAGTEYDIINQLTQYFPAIKLGSGLSIHARWDPAITLANQLLECVL